MPKHIDDAVKLRIIDLLLAGAPVAGVVRTLLDEGHKVSRPTVAQMAEWNGIEIRPAGRPTGIPNPKPKTSPHRDLLRELTLYDPPLSLSEMAVIVGISKARVHQILTDES